MSSNLERASDHFPEFIISIPSDASHLYLVKPVSHASKAEAVISVHASGMAITYIRQGSQKFIHYPGNLSFLYGRNKVGII